ncbi:unnamed protein product [Caenorhabditis sp. 36 PRJEB53466]|nr:unnamed protein product [Caenorhabditis sp. 36 PRJEB53466]
MVCSTELVDYLHIIHYVGFFGAQFLNSVLVFLIVTRSEILGDYRYAMLVFTFCSMLYSCIEIVVQPVAHMKGAMFMVFMHSHLFDMPKSIGRFLTCLHCVLSGFVASLLACQFIYRYLALCKTHMLAHLQSKRLSLIFIPSLFVFTVWHLAFFDGMPYTLEKQLYIQEELATCFHVDSASTPFVGSLYWVQGSDGEIEWKPMEVVASLSCCVTLVSQFESPLHLFFIRHQMCCFFTILFCASRIYSKMKEAKHHLSAKTLDVNRQLFRMLSIQTVIPMITMYTPVALFVILPMFGKDIPYLGNLTSSSLAVYPFLEPIIAITCVASFRKAVIGALHLSSSPSRHVFSVSRFSAT